VDVPGFVSLVSEKRYAEALRVHRERNPFAAVCARVCFHTCEDKCRRASLDDSVAIRAVKRFMVEQEITVQLPEVRENPENATKKVAIVGGGPAGLSCAYFLARLGYRPTVLEAEPRPGGMLVQTIPSYRLPRETLAREIRMIERLGADIQTGKRLGTDYTLESLRNDGYEAVFVAIGAPSGVTLNLPGKDAEGVTEALNFLKAYNLRGSVPVGRNVVIIGGGNAAIDAARTALRLDAESVTIVYRRTREEMPAYSEEINEALQEGVKLKLLTSPMEIVTKADKVVGLKCAPMTLGEFDRSGRRRPEADQGQEFVIPADQVIFACGQRTDVAEVCGCENAPKDQPDGSVYLPDGSVLTLTDGRTIKADPITGRTSVDWLYAGGDAVTGPSSVVEAIAGGERAAVGIDQYLSGSIHAFWRLDQENDTAFDPDADPLPYQREAIPVTAVERRRNNFDEVERPWTEAVAIRQAKRCLRCDFGK
jgi:NADH-quinone oxidoreductase subunit F